MNDFDISLVLRNLSDDYSGNRISFSEYRLQRKAILLQLDEDCNQTFYHKESECHVEENQHSGADVPNENVVHEIEE